MMGRERQFAGTEEECAAYRRVRHNQSANAWASRNRDKIRAKKREWYKMHKNKHSFGVWKGVLKSKYGISFEDYRRLQLEQGNRCAICFGTGTHRKTKTGEIVLELCVDHCHRTGKVRGLLCNACNSALGRFRDDPAILKRAIAYLETSNGTQIHLTTGTD